MIWLLLCQHVMNSTHIVSKNPLQPNSRTVSFMLLKLPSQPTPMNPTNQSNQWIQPTNPTNQPTNPTNENFKYPSFKLFQLLRGLHRKYSLEVDSAPHRRYSMSSPFWRLVFVVFFLRRPRCCGMIFCEIYGKKKVHTQTQTHTFHWIYTLPRMQLASTKDYDIFSIGEPAFALEKKVLRITSAWKPGTKGNLNKGTKGTRTKICSSSSAKSTKNRSLSLVFVQQSLWCLEMLGPQRSWLD